MNSKKEIQYNKASTIKTHLTHKAKDVISKLNDMRNSDECVTSHVIISQNPLTGLFEIYDECEESCKSKCKYIP